MGRDRHVDHLMEKLLRAIECSLTASQAAREVVEEILRAGAGTVFLSTTAPDGTTPEGGALELTRQDREFLRTLSIRPDSAE